MSKLAFSACSLSVFLAAVAGQAPRASAVLIEKELLSSTILNTLDAFGRSHTSTGNAQLSMSPTGTLVVSNIGSSGLDGVTFSIGDVRGLSMSMDIGDLSALAPGGLVEVTHPYSFGDQTVYVREDNAGSAMLGFSTTNPAGRCATVTILDNGTPVATHDLDDDEFGDFGDLVSGDMGSDPVTGRGITISTSQVEWDYVCTITLPTDSQLSLTGPGQTPVTGNQISISLHGLPPGETVTGDIRVTCSNLGQDLEITGERSILPSTRSRNGTIKNLFPPTKNGNGYARVIPFGAVQTTGTPEAVFCNTFPNWGQQLDTLSPERGLTVSNIGSSGLDGVRVSYGDTTPCGPGFFVCPDGSCVADPADCDTVPTDRVVYFGRKDLAAPDYLDLDDDGDSLRLGATGVSGGVIGTDFGDCILVNAVGGGNQLTLDADFSSIGSDLMQVQVYSDGQIVGVFDHIRQPGGTPIGQITPSAAGMDITSCGKFVGGPPFGPPCFFFTTDGDFTLFGGGQVLVGDECRVLATGNPTPIDFITSLEITGTNLEPFDLRLQSEQDLWATTGRGTVAMGTAMQAEGGAAVGTSPGGGLVVSNIGSSGLDGVRVPIGDASGASFGLAAGGEFTIDSFFDIAYSISPWPYNEANLCTLAMRLQATTPDRVTVTGSATDPTALLTVTPRDEFGNPLGSFIMDQTQSVSGGHPLGIPIKVKGNDVGHRRDPIGDTIVEFAVCHFAADPGGGGGTTLTSPAGVAYPDVYSVEVCVTTAAPFDAKYDGHVTIIKSHDPGGGSGTTGDMVFSSLGKKGYDYYMASSGQARTHVETCVNEPGNPVNWTKLSASNIGSSGLDGVSVDLSPLTCKLNAACCDDDCDGDIDGLWTSFQSMDCNGAGDLKLKVVGKKSPASGGGSISYVGTCDASDPAGGGGGDIGLAVSDDGGAVYVYGATVRLFDAAGTLLGSHAYQPGQFDVSRMATRDSGNVDGRYQWSMVQEFDPAEGRIRLRPDVLTMEWDEISIVTLPTNGTLYQNVARCEIQIFPTQASPMYFDEPVSLDTLFTAPAGELESLSITDFGLSRFAPPCQADLNGDGFLDNGDINAFITLFILGDIAVDFNGDGFLDNGDINAFIALFIAGC